MAFDFPANPSLGQTYKPVGTLTYVWDGLAWTTNDLPTGLRTVFTSDAPPANPTEGALWWESDSGRLYVYFNDGNSLQWVQISGPLSTGLWYDTGTLTLPATPTYDIDLPADTTMIDLMIDGLSNTAVYTPFVQLRDASGVVGGTQYFGNTTVMSGTPVLAAWASNIAPIGATGLSAAAAILGQVLLRRISTNRWSINAATIVNTAVSHYFNTGVCQLVTPPFAGIRIGATGANLDAGIVRVFYRRGD